jgi:2-amino-4-hydroxy-6-hydroxymethyldihydropteridine diphosphokinase/dihydropteroate synthase
METIYVGLGSNVGHRLKNLQEATDAVRTLFPEDFCSSIVLETPAILPPGAPKEWDRPYLNMVVGGRGPRDPESMLKALSEIERRLGRPSPHEKWAPRPLDLDILLWGNEEIRTPSLRIPHGELLHRPFWGHLLALLDPLRRIPGREETVGSWAASIPNIERCFTRSLVVEPRLVGIVNVTPDSFSDGGKYWAPDRAIAHVKRLVKEGASVVDVGALSTRPGVNVPDVEEEWARLEPVLDGICGDLEECELSLDSFRPEIVRRALERYPTVGWINDQSGGSCREILEEVAERGIQICVMHALCLPPTRKYLPPTLPPIDSILSWAEETVRRLERAGIAKEKIVLDPGIGFGKSSYQNFHLIKSVSGLRATGCKVLVGHSRKSYLSGCLPLPPPKRDVGTLAVSEVLRDQGVDYLRVHNVADHQHFFVVGKVLNGMR